MTRWLFLRLLAVIVALGALAACGDDDDDDADSTSQEGGDDRTLTIADPEEPPTLDPTISVPAYKLMLPNVTQGLTWTDEELQATPLLAESWEQVDGTSWRFELRQGVRFHNGDEMTPEDVAASINYFVGRSESELLGLTGLITGAEADGDNAVLVSTSGVQLSTPSRLRFVSILPQSQIEEEPESLETLPIGTGPFVLEEWSSGQDMRMTAFEDYWGDAPYFNEVVIRFVAEPAVRLQSLQAGEIDLAPLPGELAAEAPQLISQSAPRLLMLRFDTHDGVTADPDVRRALNLAIDRQALLDSIFQGYGEINSQIFPTTSPGYLDDVEPYAYDPEEAQQLVEAAGATGETVTLVCWTASPDLQNELCQAIQPMIEATGLTVDLQLVDVDPWLDAGFTLPQTQPGVDVVDLWFYPHDDYFVDFFRQADTLFTCESVLGAFCDEEIDSLVEEARAEADPERQLELAEEIARMLYEEGMPYIPILQRDFTFGASEGLQLPTRADDISYPVFEMSRSGG